MGGMGVGFNLGGVPGRGAGMMLGANFGHPREPAGTRKRCRTLADPLDGGGSFKKPMYESIVLPILDDSQTEKASSTW
jgi:hypothetical protein